MAGDVVYLQGSGFGTSPQVRYAFNDTNWASIAPLSASSEAAMVQFPAGLSRLPDLMAVQVSADGYNWSPAVYINQAKAYSFDTNQVGPGNSFRTFGRNLMFSRTPTVRLVDGADGSSHSASVNTGSSTSYALVATAPYDIQANHSYSVYISNGYNGNGGSGGETLASASLTGRYSGSDYWNLGVPWAADLNFTWNVYNIQNDPRLTVHASGYGGTGDAGAIDNAIWTASKAGGGIVYLPAGTYDLFFSNGCGFTLLPKVAVVGAGASSTFVNFGYGAPPGAGQGGYAVCFGTSQNGVSDITFNNVNQSGQWPQSAAGVGGNEIFIQRTNWNIANAQWLVLQQATNLTIQNSSITQGIDPSYNGPLSVSGSSNFVVRGNTIKYVDGEVDFDSTTNGVFENNTVIRDASQTVPSWVVTHVVVGNFANGLMLLNNSFGVTGGTLPSANDGETIGSESGGQHRYDEFRGTVQAASAYSVTDYGQNFNYSFNNTVANLRVGATIAIVSGTGAGQWAVVTAVSGDGHTVYTNKPWTVLPTYGSTYATFDWGAANWIIAGNTMSNNEKGIEFFNASIRDILIANNTLINNGEILLSPTEQPNGAGLFNLILNTQILGNSVTDNNYQRPAAISVVPREDGQTSNFGTAVIGLEIRGNSITGTSPNTLQPNISLDDSKALTEGINLYWQWQTLGNLVDNGIPSLLGTVIQGNHLTNSSVAFELDSGDYQTVLASNVTTNVGLMKEDTILPGISHGSVGTVTPGPAASGLSGGTNGGTSGVAVTVFSQSDLWTTELASGSSPANIYFGVGNSAAVPGDYDGDGVVDCAVFLNGNYVIRPSSNPSATQTVFFGNWYDVPAPGDYDGDGKTDIAVFRPSTGQWFYSPSSQPGSPNVMIQTTAVSTDVVVPGDFDGDGKTDFAYFRPSTGTFYQMMSGTLGVIYRSPFSLVNDVAVAGDYDGDGKTDLAVYRPSTGTWYYRPSSHPDVVLAQPSQGLPGDIPVPGDYDADGKTDFAVWRPSTQTWYVILSSNPGVTVTVAMSGLSGVVTPLSLTPGTVAAKVGLAR
jgi:parallel beta-helix repeat protein